MKVLQGIGIVVLFLVVLVGLPWLVMGNDFFLAKVFMPRMEGVRRETFEQSKAYNQGMIQEIQNMQFEYAQAGESQKEALADVILHRVADYDLSKMPADTQAFIQKLKSERTK